MKVRNMPNGSILWDGYTILGIKGNTLEEKYGDKYYDCDYIQEGGNSLDFSLVKREVKFSERR